MTSLAVAVNSNMQIAIVIIRGFCPFSLDGFPGCLHNGLGEQKWKEWKEQEEKGGKKFKKKIGTCLKMWHKW